MKTILLPLLATLTGLFRSRAVLHLEIIALRQQLAMVADRNRKLRFRRRERWFWIWLYRIWPGCLATLAVFKADTLVRWHRRGFRRYWTGRSRRDCGSRPPVSREVQALIRRLSRDNPLWGAPRVHGELKMLGIETASKSVIQTKTARIICYRLKSIRPEFARAPAISFYGGDQGQEGGAHGRRIQNGLFAFTRARSEGSEWAR